MEDPFDIEKREKELASRPFYIKFYDWAKSKLKYHFWWAFPYRGDYAPIYKIDLNNKDNFLLRYNIPRIKIIE